MQDGTSIHELSDVVDNSCSVIFVDNNINLMTIIGTIDNKGSFDANITIKGDGFDHQSEDLPVCVNDICESLEKSASFIQCSFVTQRAQHILVYFTVLVQTVISCISKFRGLQGSGWMCHYGKCL